MRPGITLCVVFTTGETILRRLLESVKPWVEEIVAVDTGAKDGARKVAEEFGARIYDLEWPDAFDEAYNFAFDKVETEWTWLFDSDEWFLQESGPELRELIEDDSVYAIRTIRQDLCTPDTFSEMYMLRLWRTHPLMRMQGIIHAQFPVESMQSAGKDKKEIYSQIRFRHDGFIGGESEEKKRRNLPYMERELQVRPGQDYFEVLLAVDKSTLGDKDALEKINKITDKIIEKESVPMFFTFALEIAMNAIHGEDLFTSRTEKLIRAIWRFCPEMPTMIWTLAGLERRRRNPYCEFFALMQLEEMGRTNKYTRYSSFDPAILTIDCWKELGLVSFAIGRYPTTVEMYRRVLTVEPENENAIEALSALGAMP